MRSWLLLSAAAITLGALVGSPALAQTPDGETPAVETICDPLQPTQGGTPGLFGLCVAYCEAQDCNPTEACQAENMGDAWGAHACGCSDILDNYNNKRQPGDPSMPCIMEVCPCYDADYLVTEISTAIECIDTVGPPGRTQALVVGTDADGCDAFANSFINFDAQGSPRSAVCQAFNRDGAPCQNTLNTLQTISFQESAVCQTLVRAYVADQGLTCN